MNMNIMLHLIKRDLNSLHGLEVNYQQYVSPSEVMQLVERWIKVVDDEKFLKKIEEEFRTMLYGKRKLYTEDYERALELLMLMHSPFIKGRDSVLAVRLRDADYIRLVNRMLGNDIEKGIEAYNDKVEVIENAERKKQREDNERKRLAAERKKEADERKQIELMSKAQLMAQQELDK